MKYDAQVDKVEGLADGVRVTLTNVRQKSAADWREYSAGIAFDVPDSQKKAYWPGRWVEITVEPKP